MRDILMDSLQLDAQLHQYQDGGHWVNEPQGVDDIAEFLEQNMRKSGNSNVLEGAEELRSNELFFKRYRYLSWPAA